MSPLPTATIDSGVAAINGIIYVAGGENSSMTPIQTLQAYDPTNGKSGTWTTKANMPTALFNPCSATEVDGKLYVAGGSTSSSSALSSLYVYDPAADTWATKSNMPHDCSGGSGGEIDGELYVSTGSVDGKNSSNKFDMYDPSTDSWTSLTPSTGGHRYPAAGVINGEYYLAGGLDLSGNSSVVLEVYDPGSAAWTTLQSLRAAVFYPASASLNGRLYVIGGCSPENSSCSKISRQVYVYDSITDVWTPSFIPSALAQFGATTDYGIAYAFGGLSAQNTVTNTNISLDIKPVLP